MKPDKKSTTEGPEKIVLDFLIYIEKETPIRFDVSKLSREFMLATSDAKELNTTITMPAELYYVPITNFHLDAVLRYCPCECCNEVVYVQLLVSGDYNEICNANIVMKHIKKAVPDMTVYITKKPKPLQIKNNPADFLY